MTKPLTDEELCRTELMAKAFDDNEHWDNRLVERLIATVRQLQERLHARYPDVDEAYEAGRAAEREECAKLAELLQLSYCEYDESLGHHAAGQIAESIRARK
jgi:hypothetical protein